MSERDQFLSEEKETGRIEAFSDGVFAIAITLLVLDIKVPHIYGLSARDSLFVALMQQWPMYLAYCISFFTILIIWANHHCLFNFIRRSDDRFVFLNGMVLLLVTFVPFPTALLSEYIRSAHAQIAAAVYSGTYLLIAFVFNLAWGYASYGNRLLDRHADPCLIKTISRQYRIGLPLYLGAFLLSFIWVPASITMCFVLALFFAFTGKISRMTCEYKKKS